MSRSGARQAGVALVFLWFLVGGIGLIVLTVAVTPAHVYMLQEPQLFPSIPYWALLARLPLQAALIALIWWSAVRRERGSG